MKREIREPVVSFLHAGTQFTGNIEAENDLCIHGLVTGTINATQKLVIGASAQVEGDIYSPSIAIFGAVNGNIISSGSVSLKNTSKVTGTIQSVQIEIEPGAEFNGDCCIEQKDTCVN